MYWIPVKTRVSSKVVMITAIRVGETQMEERRCFLIYREGKDKIFRFLKFINLTL